MLASEAVPYVVLPGGTFRDQTGLAFGDVVMVIFGNKMAGALAGDLGPANKSEKVRSDCMSSSTRPHRIRARAAMQTVSVKGYAMRASGRMSYSLRSQDPRLQAGSISPTRNAWRESVRPNSLRP